MYSSTSHQKPNTIMRLTVWHYEITKMSALLKVTSLNTMYAKVRSTTKHRDEVLDDFYVQSKGMYKTILHQY